MKIKRERKKRTPEMIETVRNMVDRGFIKAQIARSMGLAESTIENICYVYNIEVKNTFRNIDYTCEMFQTIIKMLENGSSIEEISEEVYMPIRPLSQWINQYEREKRGPVERTISTTTEPSRFRMRDLPMPEFEKILKRVDENLKKDFNHYKKLNKKKA